MKEYYSSLEHLINVNTLLLPPSENEPKIPAFTLTPSKSLTLDSVPIENKYSNGVIFADLPHSEHHRSLGIDKYGYIYTSMERRILFFNPQSTQRNIEFEYALDYAYPITGITKDNSNGDLLIASGVYIFRLSSGTDTNKYNDINVLSGTSGWYIQRAGVADMSLGQDDVIYMGANTSTMFKIISGDRFGFGNFPSNSKIWGSAIDIDQNVYCVDPYANTVYKLDPSGNIVKRYTYTKATPVSIFYDNGFIYVINQAPKSVYRFDTNLNPTKIISESMLDSVGEIWHGTIDQNGSIYIVDNTNDKIIKFDKLIPPSISDESIIHTQIEIDDQKNNLLNSLAQLNIPSSVSNTTDTLNSLEDITKNQNVSVTIPVPKDILPLFTSNKTTYPDLVGSTLPVLIATTENDSKTGNQYLNANQLQVDSIVVVPSLVSGSNVKVGDSTLLRGIKDNANKLSIDNGVTWYSIGSDIPIGDLILTVSGIGSPVIFTIKSGSLLQKILSYVFMYSYVISFVGAVMYALSASFSTDLRDIVINKNISIFFNVYVFLCGFISIYIWYNNEIPFNLINKNMIKTSMD